MVRTVPSGGAGSRGSGEACCQQGTIRGVDIQDTDSAARAYEADVKSPYPVGPAIHGSYHDFGVTAPPETFFVDRHGTVQSRVIGPVDAQQLEVYMAAILG